MIPARYLAKWRTHAPWLQDAQVEQDLVITKALIQIYSDPHIAEAFAFRGGTAMQKLYYPKATRYSEDIDLVQVRKEKIGESIDVIRKIIDPWLGEPKRSVKQDRATLIYRFDSEISPVQRMRLKIEINTGEQFSVLDFKKVAIRCENEWFSGEVDVLTYEIEELLGTKMRALFQRKKGRDLYDLSMAHQHFDDLDLDKIIHCFKSYMDRGGTPVTRAQFEANLAEKLSDSAFLADIQPLLVPGAAVYDAIAEAVHVKTKLISLLPGEPWKGPRSLKNKAGV
jgi:predicted nucleotidyltransferase component of viral defense system